MGADQYLPTLGQRVAKLRDDFGWNKRELADALRANGTPVHNSTVSRIESNDRHPSGDVLAALAKVLGTTTDYLLAVTDDPLPKEDEYFVNETGVGYDTSSTLVRSLLETVSRLSRSDQAMLLGIAERLASASQPRIIGGEADE